MNKTKLIQACCKRIAEYALGVPLAISLDDIQVRDWEIDNYKGYDCVLMLDFILGKCHYWYSTLNAGLQICPKDVKDITEDYTDSMVFGMHEDAQLIIFDGQPEIMIIGKQ